MHTILYTVGALSIAAGLASAVLPLLPGIAVLGELSAGRGVQRWAQVGVSAWVGLIFGTLFKLVASLMMVAMFGAAWWWNRGT